jgi:hypothetical protein
MSISEWDGEVILGSVGHVKDLELCPKNNVNCAEELYIFFFGEFKPKSLAYASQILYH